MEKLNLRTPKAYDYGNESETILPRKKFYCVSEGATEESYFWGVRNNKVELNIKNDVFIEVIPKEDGQETLSHPMQLVKACLFAMGRIDENYNNIPENEWDEHCQWNNYKPDIDTVCVIFDRDYKKLEKDLVEIFQLCETNGIRVVISNPNFELWLLMHFSNIGQYDPDMLLENKKNLRHQLFEDASVHKKYLEILVAKNAKGYSKGKRLKFESFLPLVDIAVEQAKMYCEEPKEIINRLGTTVGRLMEDIRL